MREVLIKFPLYEQRLTLSSSFHLLVTCSIIDVVLSSAIAKVGQRVPLAHRYAKMLEDMIIKRCGPASGYPAQITFPRSLHLDDLHTLFEESNNLVSDDTLRETLYQTSPLTSL